MSLQSLRQQSVRDVTGTALDYNGDWLALFADAGFTTGTFNERMLAYLNDRLAASHTSLPAAMQAFAVDQGFANWSSMGTFDAAGGPALSLDFTTGALDPRITFSRTSLATMYDETGKLTYCPNNLLTYSEQFDNAAWVKNNSTITANAAVAPDGTTTAESCITASGTFIASAVGAGSNISWTTLDTRLLSVYAKDNGLRYLNMGVHNGAGLTATASFDLQSGSVAATGANYCTLSSAAITSVGNGWYRCSVVITATSSDLKVPYVSGSLAFGGTNNRESTGNGVSSIYIWGAQLEAVTYQTTPRPYVATTAAAYYGPRFDYDPVTLLPKGLLIEEARTNLLTYSQEFNNAAWAYVSSGNASIAANAILAPDGTTTADKYYSTTTNSVNRQCFQIGRTITSGAAYTASAYLKAGEMTWAIINIYDTTDTNRRCYFNLSTGAVGTVATGCTAKMEPVGNGWWRCIVTKTSAAASGGMSIELADADGAVTYTGVVNSGIYLWGAQYEQGSFATSYIPTSSASVTRAADSASMTGTNFSDWYRQDDGTFVWEASTFKNSGGLAGVFVASDGTANNRLLGAHHISGTRIQATVIVGGATQGDLITATSSTPGTFYKTAFAYKADDLAASTGGAAVVTDASANIPTVDRLSVGIFHPALPDSNRLNGHIKSLVFHAERKSDADLQALTAA